MPGAEQCNSVISSCEKATAWEAGMWLMQHMQLADSPLDFVTYSAAVSVCNSARLWKCALKLMSETKAHVHQLDVSIYNAASTACDNSGHWQHACCLVESMRSADFQPDILSFHTVVNSQEKARQPHLAPHLLSTICKLTVDVVKCLG